MNKTKNRLWFHYFIELLIVIIGISIAFWLNKISTNHSAKKERISYLKDIRSDLKTDSMRLDYSILYNKAKTSKMARGLELVQQRGPIDSVLIYVIEIGNYDFFKPDYFTLKSLLQSGDFKLIESEAIKRELLRLLKMYEAVDDMQNNFLDALDQNFFPMLLSKMDMTEFRAEDEQFFYSTSIKNYFGFTLNETNTHINSYKSTRKQVVKLMRLIDENLE